MAPVGAAPSRPAGNLVQSHMRALKRQQAAAQAVQAAQLGRNAAFMGAAELQAALEGGEHGYARLPPSATLAAGGGANGGVAPSDILVPLPHDQARGGAALPPISQAKFAAVLAAAGAPGPPPPWPLPPGQKYRVTVLVPPGVKPGDPGEVQAVPSQPPLTFAFPEKLANGLPLMVCVLTMCSSSSVMMSSSPPMMDVPVAR